MHFICARIVVVVVVLSDAELNKQTCASCYGVHIFGVCVVCVCVLGLYFVIATAARINKEINKQNDFTCVP